MKPVETALLTFSQASPLLDLAKPLRDGLSVVVQMGPTLWVANDETISVERLSFQGRDAEGRYQYGAHQSFPLTEYLSLPIPPAPDAEEVEEVDVEGLDFHDGYLWVVGSHSLKRSKVKSQSSIKKNFERLADAKPDQVSNRFLLARIPLVTEGTSHTLTKQVLSEDGTLRTAAQLPATAQSNLLTQALREDGHLKNFLVVPGKDNGFDIEGLAVRGNRVFLGLRGPVLRGWAVVLELEVANTDPATLQLIPINPGNPHNPNHPTYRKHFLQLDGLGIRDLIVQGADLLILAGPTMELDGPVTLYRWPGGAQPVGESLVFRDQLVLLRSIPFGQGDDHAEGMTLFRPDEQAVTSILVVYDATAAGRKVGENGVLADMFALL
ncbi:DUF3616 domain-containing protein [Spirosoma arcticum]